jgi:hypothetical protein
MARKPSSDSVAEGMEKAGSGRAPQGKQISQGSKMSDTLAKGMEKAGKPTKKS